MIASSSSGIAEMIEFEYNRWNVISGLCSSTIIVTFIVWNTCFPALSTTMSWIVDTPSSNRMSFVNLSVPTC